MTKDKAIEGYKLYKEIDQLSEFLKVLPKALSIKVELDFEHGVYVGKDNSTYYFRPRDIEFSKVKYNIKEILSSKLEDLNNRLENL